MLEDEDSSVSAAVARNSIEVHFAGERPTESEICATLGATYAATDDDEPLARCYFAEGDVEVIIANYAGPWRLRRPRSGEEPAAGGAGPSRGAPSSTPAAVGADELERSATLEPDALAALAASWRARAASWVVDGVGVCRASALERRAEARAEEPTLPEHTPPPQPGGKGKASKAKKAPPAPPPPPPPEGLVNANGVPLID